MSPLDALKALRKLRAKKKDDTELGLDIDDELELTQKETKSRERLDNSKKKKLVLGVLLAIITCSGASFLYFSNDSDAPPTQINTHKKGKANSKNEQDSGAANVNGIDLAKLSVNPFVEIDKGEMVASGDNIATPAPVATANASYQGTNRALPAIPSGYPRPNLPTFNKPAIPSSAPANNPSPSAKPEISGIMTGNDGESIAIMSDGNVVMAGETYNDNRIAYIGGDGIHFGDGSSIEYK